MEKRQVRLALYEEEIQRLHPINVRLVVGLILLFSAVISASTASGIFYLVRQDFQEYNRVISATIAQRDRLMQICVVENDKSRKKLNFIGGEEK